MDNVILIFLDGVGIGRNDPGENPFFRLKFRFIEEHFGEIPHLGNQFLNSDNKYIFPVDARMGVDLLPQSGTGQTSIFCGVNAPEILGRHFGPFPHSELLPVLEEKNILDSLIKDGKKVTFLNAYPERFFQYIKSGKKRLTATTMMAQMSGMSLYRSTDIWRGRALSADITNDFWINSLGYKLNYLKPKSAAQRVIRISSKFSLTLFEYFLTDHLGHGRVTDPDDKILDNLDEFLYQLICLVPDNTTLVVCSDHGNLENVKIKTHTMNPAFTLTAGKHAKRLRDKIYALSDIKGAILEIL